MGDNTAELKITKKFLEIVLIFRNILICFLLRQGNIDANSHSYLRKFCSSMSGKDAK